MSASSSSTSQQASLVSAVVAFSVTAASVAWYQKKKRDDDKKKGIFYKDPDAVASTPIHAQRRVSFDPSLFAGSLPPPPLPVIDTSLGSLAEPPSKRRILSRGTITIAHGSVTGTCAKLAEELQKTLKESIDTTNRCIQLGKLEEWDWWDELLNNEEDDDEQQEEKKESGRQPSTKRSKDIQQLPIPVLLIVLPTHHEGSWPAVADCLETALNELKNDWRIAKSHLKDKLQVSVMGMGCSDYDDKSMGKPAKQAFQWFRELGAQTYGRQVRVGDDAVTDSADKVLQAWIHHDILPRLIGEDDDKHADYLQDKEPQVVDMEDMGVSMERDAKVSAAKDDDESGDDDEAGNVGSSEPREMVTAAQAVALKKEGYKLIGTHSAVKLCRWTKHQLRGRGGCYKHTFYGITSYQCMEATPSLACANKCVFCWRHHKNPVGKEWKWKTDDPHFIVEQAVQTHVQMIKETKGIPGVNLERWKEAHTVRHCALSLVGEPIMYPRIDELLADLHTRNISTFLVTNGQHPQAIGALRPVTQLYVSVDASTPESLIAIDRPLFSDAWERLQQSLTLLKDKGQRTVARLTVVKGWNSDEVEGYAKLIALGKVSLVEVKGVTFCGKSDASNLNMSNTPWHHEVVELCQNLKCELEKLRQLGGPDAPPEYDFACEHKHSVSVLLARVDQFTDIDDNGNRRWRTWIDYPKFQALAARHAENPVFTFRVQDYTAVTPSWALFGSEEEGFDPTDNRHRKKQKYPKYTKFDNRGIPTHDHNNEPLSETARQRLSAMMDEKMKEIGCGSTVTEMKGGEKVIQDASLMFRGLVIVQ